MANNTTLLEVKDQGWLNGFGPLWRKENHAWWGTRSWLVQMIVWVVVVDGLLAMATLGAPMLEAIDNPQAIQQAETRKADEPVEQDALAMYFLLAAMLPTFGVIVLGQDIVIQERQTGTAAWVLSKPVSRATFLLSKLAANSLGVLATMVLAQGFIAYFLCKASTGIPLSVPGFLAGMGMIFLFLVSVLALTLMLGTLFQSRGPLLGIATAYVSGTFLASIVVPGLGKVMPSYMFWASGNGQPSLAVTLALGQPLPTVFPILVTVLLAILFSIIALVRFQHEEF